MKTSNHKEGERDGRGRTKAGMAGLGRSEVSEEALPSLEGRGDYAKGKDKTEFPEIISDRAGSYKAGVKTIVLLI